MEQFTEFYLVEVNKNGEESALMQNYSNSFVRGASPANAYKFKDEEQVKKVCAMQNMLAGIFNNGTKTYYVKQDVTRTKFDEQGQPYSEEME
ncbi:hypothetical protein MUA33_05455 [Staphylococcus delphini]|uniref:hypothetical protein n=1 Tax=Staphylococcus TaxID=1279 RepID=UPI000BBCA7BB|nr:MULTISPECIES: hypothetical protein [Staphylococcus]PCF48953.1 hypothetical protein B5C09_03800 [Staphylococcus delphini]UXR32301.1 hypothetical protein MUA81_10435 [Staphylococcus simulans]UXS21166.1 hypothetical protein MUA22_10075 [Staphylococcus delphini]UXS30219.1 hypothetical protein MUA33_05455 [Staphylococcus delphini]UXS37891.1 hypothetical protein MUA34_05705 [Staphylococcus delphini]